MFARGWACLHAAHLPVPKSLAARSSVSVTSKLIEIKGLQILHFGHLRKTGGRGSYLLVHTAYLPLRKPHGTKSNHSRTCAALPQVQSFPHLRDTRGWGVWSYQSDSAFCSSSTSFTSSTSFSSFCSPLSLSSHSTPRLLRVPLPERNLPMSRLFPGARPAGMSPFAYRCLDAHH
jgi:hypothetical protein